MNKKMLLSNILYNTYFIHHRKNYLIGSEDVTSDEVQERILQTAGRAARRVVQQKIVNDYSESRSDDASYTNDNQKQILAMENFNGLQEWNARAESLKEKIKVSMDLKYPDSVIDKLRVEYMAYLDSPYVNVKHSNPEKESSTPFSAPPKIVRVGSNKQSAHSVVSQQVRHSSDK